MTSAEMAADAVPNSAGRARPRLAAPSHACDCHIHVYDAARFPPLRPASRMQRNATVADYRLLQRRNGTARVVLVTAAVYATDNRVTLDAIAQFGENARGVAVVGPDITDAELEMLHRGGIRGIRFTQFDPATAVTTIDMVEPLSRRVAALGWHVQIHMRGDQIAAAESLWERLPCPIVFDHMGRLPQPAGIDHPAYPIIRRLIDRGRTWVKLSGAYLDSTLGRPSYADIAAVARAFVAAAPERMVWGSDWPHPTETDKPDDAALFDLLADWAPGEDTRRRILVTNPETLYGFARSG
ncbi:MAG TPA: amidohydrolase family protein [Xanthobacteraceae bacterium]|nr:amidohydrolase family protein [Xanthobacteraceae bacterium]